MEHLKIRWKHKTSAFAVIAIALLVATGPASRSRLRMASDGSEPVGLLSADAGVGGHRVYDDPGYGQTNFVTAGYYGGASMTSVWAEIIPSGGGTYITWYNLSEHNGTNHYRVQKIDTDGSYLWGMGTDVISTNADQVSSFSLVTDGAGGAYAVWADDASKQVFAQRINSAGQLVFGTPTVGAVSGECFNTSFNPNRVAVAPQDKLAVSDGAGGVIFGWNIDDGTGDNVYCTQRVDSSGSRLWTDTASSFHHQNGGVIFMVPDGAGGTFFGLSVNATWLTHIDAVGAREASCLVAPFEVSGSLMAMASDGAGGVVLVGDRSAPKAYRVSGDCTANPAWPIGGTAVTASYDDWSMMATVFGGQVVITYRTAAPTADAMAQLLNLADGSDVWGGPKLVKTHQTTDREFMNTITPGVSGPDFVFVVPNSQNNDPDHQPGYGSTLVKLDAVTGNPTVGFTPIDILTNSDKQWATLSDGAGGFLFEYKSDNESQVQSQHFDSALAPLWVNPNFITPPPVNEDYRRYQANQGALTAVSPNGGKIVAWHEHDFYSDNRSPLIDRVMARIYSSAGAEVGPAFVIDELTDAAGNTSSYLLNVDADSTGFYVGFHRNTLAENYSAIQKYDFSGNAVWPAGGVRYGAEIVDTSNDKFVADGVGGVFAFHQGVGGFYVAKIGSSGSLAWGVDGLKIGDGAQGSGSFGQEAFFAPGPDGGIYAAWTYQNRVRLALVKSDGTLGVNFPIGGVAVQSTNNALVRGLVSGLSGEAFVSYFDQNNSRLFLQKISSAGIAEWGTDGRWLSDIAQPSPLPSGGGPITHSLAADGVGGVVAIWNERVGFDNLMTQRLDPSGAMLWGTPVTTATTAGLSGGEASIAVGSTAGFRSSGVVVIAGVDVRYTSVDGTHFLGCSGTPAVISGSSTVQNIGLKAYFDAGIVLSWDVVGDGVGGAIIAAGSVGFGPPRVGLTYVAANGTPSFGGSVIMSSGRFQWSSNISVVRNYQSLAMSWMATPSPSVQDGVPYLQQYFLPWAPAAPVVVSSGGGVSWRTPDAPRFGLAPAVAGATSVTYNFANFGNVTGYKLEAVNADGTRTKVAEINDPNAVSITETGLAPNTRYPPRVLVAVNGNGDSAPSDQLPVQLTLAVTPASVTASVGSGAFATVMANGDLPNLDVGQAGIKFTVKGGLSDGATSGWVQVPSWTTSALTKDQSYLIEVQARNSAGILAEAKTLPVTVVGGGVPHLKLTMSAYPALQTDGSRQKLSSIRYVVVVVNDGTAPAYKVEVSDLLPTGLSYINRTATLLDNKIRGVSASYDSTARTMKFFFDTILAGDTHSFSFEVSVPADSNNYFRNKASAKYSDIP